MQNTYDVERVAPDDFLDFSPEISVVGTFAPQREHGVLEPGGHKSCLDDRLTLRVERFRKGGI